MMYDALYGRQSIEKKDSISVESQLEYCRYETHGDPYIEYADRGFSGKNTNRPDFEKMMNDIRAGKIKRVIVYKLDRISRSILDFANMMEVFQEYHVEFVSSTEKFDTSTPMGRAYQSPQITSSTASSSGRSRFRVSFITGSFLWLFHDHASLFQLGKTSLDPVDGLLRIQFGLLTGLHILAGHHTFFDLVLS